MRNSSNNQNGFVSIVVASLVMVILALITIGFTRTMQREQRQSLDRQLSRQALYAAESGANDIYKAILAGGLPAEKTDCDVSSILPGGAVVSGDYQIEYTCGLYDTSPTKLIYDISTTESKIVQLESDNGGTISEFVFSWGNSDSSNNDVSKLPVCGSAEATDFLATRTDTIPLLKVDLTNTADYNRASLIAESDYLYLIPCKEGTVPAPDNRRGRLVQVSCIADLAQPCSLTLPLSTASDSYLARIRPIYTTASLTIQATQLPVPGDPKVQVEFKNAQISIDMTAKANDVVRRLNVNVPYASVDSPPEAVLQAFDGVCKDIAVDILSTPVKIDDSC